MEKDNISAEEIKRMQNDPQMIRNICILAHVDHGKTTLSDSLISSNKIINQKMAGKLKYMDSRDDEQLRQITMKASSITLFHQKVQVVSKEKKEQGVKPKSQLFKINLMDSPGHVDFTNEVSSALRLSDGAIVMIDVVEGISPQSLTVLKQAWDEKVRTCLVLNKIDRLINERWMEAEDIFYHIQNIIEQVNAVISSFINTIKISKNTTTSEPKNDKEEDSKQIEGDFSDEDDEEILSFEDKFFYSPEKGNVAFTSAIDGWGFTIPAFSYIISRKLNIAPRKLSKFLWGNYYFSNGKVVKKPPTSNSKPMFVQYVLGPIVSEYRKELDKIDETNSNAMTLALERVATSLRKRIPIDKSIFNMVVNRLPSPIEQQKERLEVFCPLLANLPSECPSDFSEEEFKTYLHMKESIINCSNDPKDPVIVFISKMQPIDYKSYCMAMKSEEESGKDNKKLIGFGRVFSGKLQKGKEMYVYGVNHTREKKDVTKMVLNDIFIFMGGNNLKAVSDMNAGNIVGIGGLESVLLKMGTISSSPDCPNFAPAKLLGTGLIKVAIRPKNLSDMPILIDGLKKLDKADPSVSYYLNEKGEYILQTCGKIHLERWIKDLKDDFAQIDIEISEPIITFKETIIMKNLWRERDFDTSEKEGDWFELDQEFLDKIEADKQTKLKTGGKIKKRKDSDEEEKIEEVKHSQDMEKQDQTDM
jgi:ribosome assembly protein 1